MQKSIRQRMQESLYQTEDAGDILSESGCESLSIRQWMQETLSESGCRSLYIRQRMQEKFYKTADAEVSLPDNGFMINLHENIGQGRD